MNVAGIGTCDASSSNIRWISFAPEILTVFTDT